MKHLNLTTGILTLTLLLTECSSSSSSSVSVGEQPAETVSAKAAEPLTAEAGIVKAELKDGALTLTILSEKMKENELEIDGDEYNGFKLDTPYPVEGITGSYTQLYIGLYGMDIFPTLYLLREDGTVETVSVWQRILDEETDRVFYSNGLLNNVTGIVSFEQRETEQQDKVGTWLTAYAIDADGNAYDLVAAQYYTDHPDMVPPTAEEAIKIVRDQQYVADQLAEGMDISCGGDTVYVYMGGEGEVCTVVYVGPDKEKDVTYEYAVGISKAVYVYEQDSETWLPLGMTAGILAEGGYDDLFVMVTDTDLAEYSYYRDTAEVIHTPLEGEHSQWVMFMPLYHDLTVTVELCSYDEKTDSFVGGEVVETFTSRRGQAYYISTELAETIPGLRIIAECTDEDSYPLTAVWYSTYDGSGEHPIQYVEGDTDTESLSN